MAKDKRKKIYEGKAKILYQGTQPNTIIQYFKDDATAFNNKKFAVINGKGVLNNRISSFLMDKVKDIGIPTHFIKRLNMREQLVHKVDIIPIEVVVRNIAAGSICKRFGLKEGELLPRPIVEYYYKSDELNDPLISEEHISAFDWATPNELEDIFNMSLRVNDFLLGMFSQILILPFVAILLIKVWPISPELAVGLLIIAAAPGGVTSNVLTSYAKGDVALSISLTA